MDASIHRSPGFKSIKTHSRKRRVSSIASTPPNPHRHTHTHTHTDTHTQTHTHTNTHTNAHTDTHTKHVTKIRTHSRTHMCVVIRQQVDLYRGPPSKLRMTQAPLLAAGHHNGLFFPALILWRHRGGGGDGGGVRGRGSVSG